MGDLSANLEKVRTFQRKAREQGADLVIFPEVTMSGYTLGDENGMDIDFTLRELRRVRERHLSEND